jgi:hypothetical protein
MEAKSQDYIDGGRCEGVSHRLPVADFTHKSPRAISYVRADRAFNPEPDSYGQDETTWGRSALRSNQEIVKGRAISM